MIERARLERLHQRVLAGEPPATAEVFTLLHKPLAATVRRRLRPGLSWEEAGDTATDAIVAYIQSPGRFDPNRAGLLGYLVLVAYRDALNLLRDRTAEQKKHDRSVELSVATGKDSLCEVANTVDAERILRDHGHKIVVEEGDEDVLRLILEGERETAAYAAKLGIDHLSETEQRKVVKQRRDRIDQRLKRLREDLK